MKGERKKLGGWKEREGNKQDGRREKEIKRMKRKKKGLIG